jgi:hypothetical protein
MDNVGDHFHQYGSGYQVPYIRHFSGKVRVPPQKRYHSKWVNKGILINDDKLDKHMKNRFPLSSTAIQKTKGQIIRQCRICPFKLRFIPKNNGQYQEQIDPRYPEHRHYAWAPWSLPTKTTTSFLNSETLTKAEPVNELVTAQTKPQNNNTDSDHTDHHTDHDTNYPRNYKATVETYKSAT